MTRQPSIVKRLLTSCWTFFNFLRRFIVNIVFFIFLIVFIGVIAGGEQPVTVPNGAALVLNLNGDIVEQKIEVDPLDALINEAYGTQEERPEVLLANVLSVIDEAKSDNRIDAIVLKLDRMQNAGLSKLQDIGKAITDFKSSGKQVIAVGDAFSQGQYYLASHANEIWLDPKGYLLLDGFGRYQLYFKSALDKLSISSHIFRVGTYKSAVEPYIRDDMSDEAKAANKLWLNDLWDQYKVEVATQRGFKVSNFDEDIDTLIAKFNQAGGSFAEYAVQNKWVDSLKTRDEMNSALVELVGQNKTATYYKNISYKAYLKAISNENIIDANKDKIAVVVAKGTILNGIQKPGTIGGDSTAKLLKKARLDDDVKAVVLRVDSPGGSAYASEIIRQEIELIKQAGKPVVASMGSMAASGGYWISASADKIIASPSTITGSIGIFGMLMTLENSLAELGVFTDGVGTTDIAGFGVTRPLTDGMAQLFQLSINRGYKDFLALVADGRNMSTEQVDAIAQGRVWSGVKAKELGLVDELGSLDDAVNLAAELSNTSTFEQVLIEKELSAADKFWQDLLGTSAAWLPERDITSGPASQLMNQLIKEIKQIDQFNDPQGIYSYCLTCELN